MSSVAMPLTKKKHAKPVFILHVAELEWPLVLLIMCWSHQLGIEAD